MYSKVPSLFRVVIQSFNKNIPKYIHFSSLKYLANYLSQQPHQKKGFKLEKKQKPT